jgi:hypothetical protein
MSKGNKRYKSNCEDWQSTTGGMFHPFYNDMMESEVGKILLGNSKAWQIYCVLVFKYQAKYENGLCTSSNKDNISLTYKEAKEYMTKRTFINSIDLIIQLGFIKIIKSGYAERKCNIFGFSNMWSYYNTDQFNIKDKWKRKL